MWSPAASLTACLSVFFRPAAPDRADDAGGGAPAGDGAGPVGHPGGSDADSGASRPAGREEATHGLHLPEL